MKDKLEYIGISPANDVSMVSKLAWLNKVFTIVKNIIMSIEQVRAPC